MLIILVLQLPFKFGKEVRTYFIKKIAGLLFALGQMKEDLRICVEKVISARPLV